MLASDVNNTEFTGAVNNPDDLLFTEFFWHEIEVLDPEKTIWVHNPQTGKKMVEGETAKKRAKVPYIRIMRPGDLTTVIETMVRDDHKARWPARWLAWQMKEGLIDGGENIPGWKLNDWPEVSADQLRELNYLRFFTVEQVGGASDAQVQRMGMGGMSVREKAKQALAGRAQSAAKEAVAAVEARHATEMAELRKQMDELKAMIIKPIAEEATIVVKKATVDPELVKQYKEKYGKMPHHKMKEETIRKALE